jgi:hypothetical protein
MCRTTETTPEPSLVGPFPTKSVSNSVVRLPDTHFRAENEIYVPRASYTPELMSPRKQPPTTNSTFNHRARSDSRAYVRSKSKEKSFLPD